MTVNSTVTARRTVSRVGVWGACGTGNLGNEMTMAAIIQNPRRLHPDIHLRAFSADPQDTFERYGIPSFPMMQEPSGGGGHRLSRLIRRAHAPFLEL